MKEPPLQHVAARGIPRARASLGLPELFLSLSVIWCCSIRSSIRRGEAARVSALFFLVPPAAALIAWLLLGEVMPPLAWIGIALVVLCVVIASRTPAPRAAISD